MKLSKTDSSGLPSVLIGVTMMLVSIGIYLAFNH
jgi:hypothetical protein